MSDDLAVATAALVEAIRGLRADQRPRSHELRVAWPTDGATWTTTWAEAMGRDLAIASQALARAKDTGATDEGAADVETALWRVDSAFEKFHDVVALTLGVPAMTLNRDKRGVRRFESDRRRNRRSVRELGESHLAAQELLDIEERIYNHRFLALRHQMTHSLAPILEWKSLMWFEVGEVDDRGSIAGYSAFHLTPSDDLQASVQPQELFPRVIGDGFAILDLMRASITKLADLLKGTEALAPPPVIWRVSSTGELYLDLDEAAQAARARAAPDHGSL